MNSIPTSDGRLSDIPEKIVTISSIIDKVHILVQALGFLSCPKMEGADSVYAKVEDIKAIYKTITAEKIQETYLHYLALDISKAVAFTTILDTEISQTLVNVGKMLRTEESIRRLGKNDIGKE